jgi:signal transduction histidine kinase
VAADQGVASIDPRQLAPAEAPLNVVIETARANDEVVAPSSAAVLPSGISDLEIDYTALMLSMPERIQFRYQLVGVDPAWHDVGTRRRAYYTDLRPGSYQFRVAASLGDGRWSEATASWSFRVLPAWYQTLWFKGLVVLAIGALGGVAVALVQRRRHARSHAELRRRYEITLAERARIAQDLHDTLLQGFAGVTLQLKAAEIALPDEPDVAAATILRVQRLARESLREARERVWDMHEPAPDGDLLPAMFERIARDRTAGLPIDFVVTTDGSVERLPREIEDAVIRIGREAIVNVVRHANASRIGIRLDYATGTFCLQVADDGRGFTPQEAEDAFKRGHYGLSGSRERASRLGGHCAVGPRPGGGTIVTLELPLPSTPFGEGTDTPSG